MTGPSPYQPTGERQFFIGGNNASIIKGACYGASLGITYIAAYLSYGDFYDWRDGVFYYDKRNLPFSIDKLKLYQNTLPKKGLLGIRPGFVENNNWDRQAVEDKLAKSDVTSIVNFLGITADNYYRIPFTGYANSPWPIVGISNSNYFLNSFFDNLSANGITIDFSMMDTEWAFYKETIDSPTYLSWFIGQTGYGNSYYGLTSWKQIFENLGGCADYLGGSPGGTLQTQWAWAKAAQAYTSKIWNKGAGDYFLTKYPNSIFSNYDYYAGENVRDDEAPEQNGFYWPQGGYAGNAGSPVLYGRIRHFSTEMTVGSADVRYDDPTRFYAGYEKATKQYPLYYDIGLASTPVQSAVVSFLQAMTEVRTAKRNAPDKPLAPWINTINAAGYPSEGHVYLKSYPVATTKQPTSDNGSQSPPEVLHDSWYENNISSLTRGFTNYDGSTSGFRLTTPVLNLMSNAWYRQNISSITFDGATTSFVLNSATTIGSTAALAYYFNQITAGVTYIFSYYIDMNRGFTAINGRFANWSTSETSTSAPSLTSTTGITFEQLLPVTGGQVYLQSPVTYQVGDSGWTKIAWKFVGTSNPRVAMHAYHARNSITGGHTAYIKDIQLEIEGTTTNTLVSINSIGSTAQASNSFTSLEYYYNGLTPGITYIFSYYTDLSRGYTGDNTLQKIHHFNRLLYNVPIGITYNQTLPVSINSLYNTSGISYASSTGWTKVSWEFSVSVGDTYDPLNVETLSTSAACVNNIYSVMGRHNPLAGVSLFISSPSLEIKSSPSNISIPIVNFDDEVIQWWIWGPAIAWGDCVKGPNKKFNTYYVNRGGNSAYFYELVRHCCLLGTKGFGLYNPEDFEDFRVPGAIKNASIPYLSNNHAPIRAYYNAAGLTQHETAFKLLDATLQDVHDKIGGYTSSTALTERVNWRAPYIANAAPDLSGTTWWWRITALQGYTVYCNGVTLSDRDQIGTWVPTSGPTLANVGITWEKWGPPIQEPNVGIATKDFNFKTMTSLSDLIAQGFTFTRGSSGSYLASNGTIVEVGINQPRFTYNPIDLTPQGLLLEASVTNLLNWSESFASTGGSQNNWQDTNLSRTIGSTAPNGLTFALRFTATAANATIISTNAIGSNAYRAFSCWLKGITGNESISYTTTNGTSWSSFNISSSWKRYSFYTTSNHQVGFRIGNTGNSVELWGAQLEASSGNYLATSYIKTNNSQVTRSADTLTISGTSFSSWIGNTYGTFVLEIANGINSNMLDLRKDSNNHLTYGIGQNAIGFGNSYRINGVLGGGNVGDVNGYLTRYFCPEIVNKFIVTYSPKGTKFLSYRAFPMRFRGAPNDGQFGESWVGNTVGPPQFTQVSWNANNVMTLNRVRYWPFVLNQPTMLQMVRGGIDPTIGYIGRWDDK